MKSIRQKSAVIFLALVGIAIFFLWDKHGCTRAPSSFASENFKLLHTIATEAEPQSVRIFDLDGDETQDVIVGNYGSASVSVFKGTGNGFIGQQHIGVGEKPRDVVVDQRKNIISANVASNSLSVIHNFQVGTLRTGKAPHSVVAVDLNADGFDEVISADTDSSQVSVYSGTTYERVSLLPMDTKPRHVAAADFDGDGRVDIVTSNRDEDTVTVFQNTSSGVVTFDVVGSYATEHFPRHMRIEDIDLDGKEDIIVVNELDSSFSVIRNLSSTGSFVFAETVHISLDKDVYRMFGRYLRKGMSPFGIDVADLNADGKPEVVVGDQWYGTFSVLENLSVPGSVNFACGVHVPTAKKPRFVEIGDINNDQIPEILVASRSEDVVQIFGL